MLLSSSQDVLHLAVTDDSDNKKPFGDFLGTPQEDTIVVSSLSFLDFES